LESFGGQEIGKFYKFIFGTGIWKVLEVRNLVSFGVRNLVSFINLFLESFWGRNW
jgi:hypothetical protein